MIRLIALPFLALILCAASCDGPTIEKYVALVKTGQYVPTEAELSQYSAVLDQYDEGSAVVEAVIVAAEVSSEEPSVEVVPDVIVPPPPDCTPWLWRGTWYDGCTGEIVGYVE